MAINNLATSLRNSLADVQADSLDDGAGAALIEIFTAGFATKLATLTHSDPAYGAASSGVVTANAITDDVSADATGTADVCRFTTSDPTTMWEGTVRTSGGDINLNTLSVTITDNVSISSMTLTMPTG